MLFSVDGHGMPIYKTHKLIHRYMNLDINPLSTKRSKEFGKSLCSFFLLFMRHAQYIVNITKKHKDCIGGDFLRVCVYEWIGRCHSVNV